MNLKKPFAYIYFVSFISHVVCGMLKSQNKTPPSCSGRCVLWTVCAMDGVCSGRCVLWTVCALDGGGFHVWTLVGLVDQLCQSIHSSPTYPGGVC